MHDPLAPRIQTVSPSDSVTATVTFALPLDPAQRLDSRAVTLRKLPDSVQRLLSTLDADLLLSALDRALNERNGAVALPLIRALGERGEFRAARSAFA